MSISENLKRIDEKISAAALKAGRKREDVTLVAVTKKVGVPEAEELLRLGETHFGENRVQSLCEKYEAIGARADWQLIGHLQTNKVKYIIDKVSLIHSVDSVRLLEEINLRAAAAGRVADVLLEVNVSGEESKFGITPGEADGFAARFCEYESVHLKGLMTIAPLPEGRGANRKYFSALHRLYDDIAAKGYENVSMELLSMGMSRDFEDAISEGASLVRIGTALFE